MTDIRERLQKNYAFADINVGYNNRIADNSCLISESLEDAEKRLNEQGLTIAGVCRSVPLSVNLGRRDMCLLIAKDANTKNLFWMHVPSCTIDEWLRPISE